jgi:hypothetical protein
MFKTNTGVVMQHHDIVFFPHFSGRIINIETLNFRFGKWKGGIDPDECYWNGMGQTEIHFLNVIRIFFEAGPPAMEEIGQSSSHAYCFMYGVQPISLKLYTFSTKLHTSQKCYNYQETNYKLRYNYVTLA